MNEKSEILARKLVARLRERGKRLGLGESCTGGLIAAAITAVPGASEVFAGAAVTYSNRAKFDLLGVNAATVKKFGAVSAECAAEMADGAARAFCADLAVSVTGIAGPAGGTTEKPVGTVFFGLRDENGVVTFRHRFSGARDEVRRQAAARALEILLDVLK